MSKVSDLNRELARMERQQARLRDQLFHAIRKYGSERAQMALLDALKLKERASEAMAEADEAIRAAVELAVEDEEPFAASLDEIKAISRLAKQVFPTESER